MTSSYQLPEHLPLRPIKTSPLPLRTTTTKIKSSTDIILGSGLTRKQKLFVENWLKGKSDKQSALEAGYAVSVAENAYFEVRNKPAVQREIRRRLAQNYKENELTTDEIIDSVRRVAEANILDYVDIDDQGAYKVNLAKVNREQADAIEELSMDAYGRPKIKLVPKLAAREMLARFKKMFSEDRNQGSGQGTQFTIQSLDSMVQQYVHNLTVNVNQVASPLPERKAIQAPTIEAEITG